MAKKQKSKAQNNAFGAWWLGSAIVVGTALLLGGQKPDDRVSRSLQPETSSPGFDHESCVDADLRCPSLADAGKCESHPSGMYEMCPRSCHMCLDLTFGVKQLVDRDRPIAWRERLEAAYDYLENIVAKDELLSKYSLDKCKNLNDHCTFWALKGRCETHRGYMKLNCAPVCHTCDQLAEETRCPLDRDAMPDVWTPGDLNAFFTNLTTLDEYQQYSPQVLSRPEYADGDTNEMANYILGPWITVLDNVITQEEANRIVELGHELGFRRSAIADGTYEGHVYDGRTSSNTWCFYDCFNDTLVQSATSRIEEITNIPSTNSEYWQLLEYKEGQFYHNHHDYSSVYKERQQGVRILTVFLYLNDVEEGGGTHFSSLNITVQPKSGRALVWPSVLNDDPSEMDPRTFHQALPVTRGVKYGANAWIHLRDFKTPLHKGCIPN